MTPIRQWLAFWITLLGMITSSLADSTRAIPLTPSIQQQQLMVDGQIALGTTPTMENALLHGIAIEYDISIELRNPALWFWQQTLVTKHMRVRLAYDSLKQTYLLTNITLSRLNTDKDLKRALLTLGSIQSLPITPLSTLQANTAYELRLSVHLERESLPNALRLSSLIDREWHVNLINQTQTWLYQP